MKPNGDFPRISTSGTLIFGLNLGFAIALFTWSSYGQALWSGRLAAESSSTMMHGCVFMTSLLNVLSHAAVVLGALQDTYVISILVGVGFDVLTRLYQLWWWMQLVQSTIEEEEEESGSSSSSSSLQLLDNCFLGLLSLLFLYQMWIHIRALLLVNNDSLERVQTVLKGALNNLRGIPGQGGKDHLFAYSDLSLHLLPCLLSGILLQQQQQLHSVIPIIVMMAGMATMVPLQTGNYDKKDAAATKKEESMHVIAKLMIIIGRSQQQQQGDPTIPTRIGCTCSACSHRMKRMIHYKKKTTSFVCNPIDGLCALWMLSFEQVSMALDQALLLQLSSDGSTVQSTR
mmetsp:Transcript_829/g.1595  ORF Transcript_829/g.1595 Transcript_829/m.1595 type:complete len:343 (-) Transcript_829:698-1726(-)